MPAGIEGKTTNEEFHARHDGEKPYFEYWDGEAVQKARPKSIHGLIQKLLTRMLDDIGYESASEVELRLDPDYEPVPDVIAMEGALEHPYPTKPFEAVVEILSPDDRFSLVLRKCRLYEGWGIRQIVVIDPQTRAIWRFANGAPVEADFIVSRGEARIMAAVLWAEVDRRLD